VWEGGDYLHVIGETPDKRKAPPPVPLLTVLVGRVEAGRSRDGEGGRRKAVAPIRHHDQNVVSVILQLNAVAAAFTGVDYRIGREFPDHQFDIFDILLTDTYTIQQTACRFAETDDICFALWQV
jgi:hypothetical protein